jgi:DNA polymerase theta
VSDGIRQEAKGIVYGVIYGMGVRTLAEQMEVEEADAAQFVSKFMQSYPKVKVFLERAVKLCREKGFIETISGRRRYLPQIGSKNPAHRSK